MHGFGEIGGVCGLSGQKASHQLGENLGFDKERSLKAFE